MAKKTIVQKIKDVISETPKETPKVSGKKSCENCAESGKYCYQCSDAKVVDRIKA